MKLPARSLSTPLVAATLALTLGIVGTPSPSQAEEPPAPMLVKQAAPAEPPPRVGLRVDTEALGGAEEPMREKLVEISAGVFNDQGFAEANEERDPRIVIVIERTGTEEQPGFVVGFSIEKGDEVVPGSARQLDCSLCTRTELVERIEGQLPGLLELAREHQEQAVVEGPPGDGDGDGDHPPNEEPIEVKKIGPLAYAGIGVGVVGLAGIGVGVGFVVKGVEPIGPTFVEQKNYRTPGAVLLGVGGAALVTGVVMIAIDLSKRKKARRKSVDTSGVRWHGAGIAF